MPTGAVTGFLDVAQLTLYAFWLFFACLIWYLRREDKREGYPLVSELPDRVVVQGFPPPPPPKTFLLPQGGTEQAPRAHVEPPIEGMRSAPWFGSPLEPGGNPMLAGIGSAAYANRADTPELTYEGETRMAPLRNASAFFIEPTDPDPRGMTVVGADNQVAGTVSDIWVDRSEPAIRYLEISLASGIATATAPAGSSAPGAAPAPVTGTVSAPGMVPSPGTATGTGTAPVVGTVLLPANFMSRLRAGRVQEVRVNAITAAQFADVPRLKNPDQVTLLEEDRISGYYAGGYLFAVAGRAEPIV